MKCQVSKTGFLPEKAHDTDTGWDLRASEGAMVYPGQRVLIKTGLRIQLPEGMDAQIRSRSGLTLKHGIVVANSPGTIDNGYIKEIGVILYNIDRRPFKVNRGDRVAQLVFSQVITQEPDNSPISFEVGEIQETERDGGFGHTGTKDFEHKEPAQLEIFEEETSTADTQEVKEEDAEPTKE